VLRLVELMAPFAENGAFEAQLADARLGEIDRSCLAAGRAKEALGWTPRVGIEEGLRLTYEASA